MTKLQRFPERIRKQLRRRLVTEMIKGEDDR
jgi:hypothetical protein